MAKKAQDLYIICIAATALFFVKQALAAKELARKQKVEDKQRFKPLATKAPLTKVAKLDLFKRFADH